MTAVNGEAVANTKLLLLVAILFCVKLHSSLAAVTLFARPHLLQL